MKGETPSKVTQIPNPVNENFKKIAVNNNIELIEANFKNKVIVYSIKDLDLQYRITPNELLRID